LSGTARRDVDKHRFVAPPHVGGHRTPLDGQPQRRDRIGGYATSRGEIIGGAQRQDPQGGSAARFEPHDSGGHLVDAPVAASCDHASHPLGGRLGHETGSIALLPGHPHIQLVPAHTDGRDGRPHVRAARLLAVENEPRRHVIVSR
jgi:hypothetical protein